MKTEVVIYRNSVTFNTNSNDFITVTDGTGELTQNELLNLALQVAGKEYGLSAFNITVLDK